MRKLKRFSHLFLALTLCIMTMCGMSVTAFAYVDPDASTSETIEDAAVPETTENEANPFTPDGNASILDEADSDQNKYFYTIQTANDNVFYMVIDKDRAAGNVYLLSMIDENDLMEFVTEEETESEDNGAIPDEFQQPTKPAETEPEPETETTDEKETEPEATDPPAAASNGTVTLIALGVLAVIFLIGYYIVKIRNRDDTEDETSHGMEEAEEEDDTDDSDLIDEEENDKAPLSEDYPDPADYPDEETV